MYAATTCYAQGAAQSRRLTMSLGAGTYSPIEISLRDKGGEVGTMRAFGITIDEDSFDDNQTLRTAFVTAIDGVALGVLIQSDYGGELRIVNPVSKAASASAQRENKLLVRYYDSVTFKKFTYSIPTIDLPNLVFLSEARDFVNPTTPASVVALVAAHQAFIVNPETQNLTTIENLEYVGKNI